MYVYVIAAYGAAVRVRALHARLRAEGYEPSSTWAEEAMGPECLDDADAANAAWVRNHNDLERAAAVIVLADTPMREGWCEVARCEDSGRDVIVVGPANLTTRALRWDHVADDEAAIRALEDYRRCPGGCGAYAVDCWRGACRRMGP